MILIIFAEILFSLFPFKLAKIMLFVFAISFNYLFNFAYLIKILTYTDFLLLGKETTTA